jgi:FkbM family methyltransferase
MTPRIVKRLERTAAIVSLKSALRSSIKKLGLSVHRSVVGRDPFWDMRRLIDRPDPVALDVGANIGQTIKRLRRTFPRPTIHAFEASRETFFELQHNCSSVSRVHLSNIAMGAKRSTMEFIENTSADMSSLLEPGSDCWGEVKKRTEVEVHTIDDYCADRLIRAVDILKTDTQGFDLEVLKGACKMLEQNRIKLILTEIIFSDQYKGLPRFDQIYGFLADREFKLVSFYDFHYQKERLGWTDALFVNPRFAI